jgi:hypothetical protein
MSYTAVMLCQKEGGLCEYLHGRLTKLLALDTTVQETLLKSRNALYHLGAVKKRRKFSS